MTRDDNDQELPDEFDAEEEDSQALALIPEARNDVPERIASPAREDARPKSQPGPSFGTILWRALVFLFKLILVLIFLSGVGVGLYFGLPILYNRYILPVETNTSNLALLETHQAKTDKQLAGLQSKLATLETEQSTHNQTLTDLDARLQPLEDGVATNTASLAQLEEMQAAFKSGNETTQLELERQIKLLKSMELLSRARLFLYESNFGLAEADIQTAREILSEVQPTAPDPLGKELVEVVTRLDLALASLPNFPVAASDDLDIAWQILLQGVPQTPPVTKTETPIITPEGTLERTLTPTPTLEYTLTPVPTATP